MDRAVPHGGPCASDRYKFKLSDILEAASDKPTAQLNVTADKTAATRDVGGQALWRSGLPGQVLQSKHEGLIEYLVSINLGESIGAGVYKVRTASASSTGLIAVV